MVLLKRRCHMSLPDNHSVMRTVIQGLGEENQLGYDNASKTFVAVKRSMAQINPNVTYDLPQVTQKLKEYIEKYDIEPADLQAVITAIRSKKTRVASSANDLTSSIASLAEQKLRGAQRQGPQKAPLQQLKNAFKEIVVNEPHEAFLANEQMFHGACRLLLGETKHEIYYVHPLSKSIEIYEPKGTDQKAIQEGLDYIARLHKAHRILDTFEETFVPRDVRIDWAEDCTHFVITYTSSKTPGDSAQIRSKGLEDLAETVQLARKNKYSP